MECWFKAKMIFCGNNVIFQYDFYSCKHAFRTAWLLVNVTETGVVVKFSYFGSHPGTHML